MTLEYLPVLTIAGSDSSGGAGIQADLKTFTVHGCYGASVTTALTAQNTTGVQAVHGVPPDFVKQQMSSVLDDVDVKAIKTGMLFDTENTKAVAEMLKGHFNAKGHIPLVCDPVCVSTSGHVLLHPDAVDTLIDDIFPLSDLITPNKSEAELLLKQRHLPSHIASLEDMISASRRLRTLGPQAVLLKGGHCVVSLADVTNISSDDTQVIREGLLDDNANILRIHGRNETHVDSLVVDVLCTSDDRVTIFARTRLESTSTHGTGCTLSAALACQLARGTPLTEAVRLAAAHIHIGIETANPIGSGFGPLNHVHSIAPRLIAPRTKTNPYPLTSSLIRGSRVIWKEYVQHEFVVLLGKGTLPKEHFLHFIKQDYLYLKYYARAYAFLAAKSHEFAPILAAIEVVFSIVRESSMHTGYCIEWGITEDELINTPESPALTAYGAFLIDAGLQGDPMKLMVALAACLLGYGEVGLWLKEEAQAPNSWVRLEGNPYLKWIEDYSGDVYQMAVKAGLETLENRAAVDAPSLTRFTDWQDVWERCTRLEKGFWDMAMNLA
ncbi:Phosphomethylpyrimidine kinase-domain-containing protein [Suillus paluster]|uniref:Phosphomethylpyrimidine kinase-domain-containing protein n=1 Tax=Suillus paluster TaxID=48578 RepID=UPI001B871BEA|nr:Phosphomethylpyrimidine kinase-domain-containing protein [Suillus paluster]KAG1736929.1 Phosphomethylpyrimidine kinase-domain-containing protein [Suillus paluster]